MTLESLSVKQIVTFVLLAAVGLLTGLLFWHYRSKLPPARPAAA